VLVKFLVERHSLTVYKHHAARRWMDEIAESPASFGYSEEKSAAEEKSKKARSLLTGPLNPFGSQSRTYPWFS